MKPDAPGWYPDDTSGRLRRWDGSRWTGETRDPPPWAPGAAAGGPAEPGQTPPKRPGRHWLVLAAVVGLVFIAVSYKAWTSGPDLPPRTVEDADFVAAANAKCRAGLKPLKEERPQPGTPEGKDPGPNERVAAQVDETADSLVEIAADLRRIPVVPADAAEVEAWLAEWDNYAEIGHRYADAVRDESKAQEDLIREGSKSSVRADRFAQANGLKDCTLA